MYYIILLLYITYPGDVMGMLLAIARANLVRARVSQLKVILVPRGRPDTNRMRRKPARTYAHAHARTHARKRPFHIITPMNKRNDTR